ncbi:putative organ specific protein [Arabidopsis thaliana]|jgi:hypothetical protein|uniref:At1g49310 n=4 Tax=Arabidopsis TaxID=3701 RepID=Q84W13_ARATH|nr:uncharacterized protein AT1G49310 [Arabidopsis thaliana]KAG7649041.1 Organ specific protein [Arabidopsis thaliana x Arabidopsis arenosa]KAG7656933.1 Organ specific protein [Arabidopsis suecica]AAO42803.1 At1g49310 [Arabidopsis thaliana]AEE32416.1 transmembrane protein [Arabidopsis thaliana]OAP18253.1 hypothetical protein AXX17_AT1G43470 [Arabidopsis thaliana]|eukprot:NP_175356.1 transmembrane protein [Arabidopsis thaliana]
MKQQQRYLVVFIVLLSFLLFVNLSEGRTGGVAEEYWKKMMKNEPLPEPIKELLNNPFRTAQERFIQNFDTKSVVIIYHNPNE